jgi:hypothetical protein
MQWIKMAEILSAALRARREQKTRADTAKKEQLKEVVESLKQHRTKRADDEYDDVELLGRGATHEESEMDQVLTKRRLVESSNVYAYHYIPENERNGILYVTFLYWAPGMESGERSGPGSTYAYYDFPVKKYHQFESATAQSAGRAVWDFCRIRGTVSGHQHRVSLVQSEGDYVPRKATVKGFAARSLLPPGVSPRDRKQFPLTRKSTLEPRKFMTGAPNRGTPNRGTPKRGRP